MIVRLPIATPAVWLYNADRSSTTELRFIVPSYHELITLFNRCFTAQYQTKLVKGGDEPIYLPADEQHPYHEIVFAHGFFSSALHECSHWLIAGEERRKLVDFGYWYAPDGRTAAQQAIFQQVEIKPQALEWILSMAAGHPFRVSIDNLNGEESDTLSFKHAVHQQVNTYLMSGLSSRASCFRAALCQFYGTKLAPTISDFDVNTC